MSAIRSEMNRFGQFIRLLFLSIVAGYILLGTFNWITIDYLRPGSGLEPLLRFRREILAGEILESRDNKYLVLGDSTAFRMIFPARTGSARGISLAAYASYSPEAYFIYNDYVKSRGAPKCVVFSSSYGGYDYHLSDYTWKMLVPAGNYSLDQLIDFHESSANLNRGPGNQGPLSWILTRALGARMIYFFDWSIFHRYLFWPENGRLTPRLTYVQIRKERGGGPVSAGSTTYNLPFDGPMQAYLKQKFEPHPVFDLYLERLLKEAESTGTQVLIYWAPLANSLRNSVSEQWVIDATKHISKLIRSHPNAEDHLEISWEPDIFFIDGNHVNQPRGAKYTRDLLPALQKCLNR